VSPRLVVSDSSDGPGHPLLLKGRGERSRREMLCCESNANPPMAVAAVSGGHAEKASGPTAEGCVLVSAEQVARARMVMIHGARRGAVLVEFVNAPLDTDAKGPPMTPARARKATHHSLWQVLGKSDKLLLVHLAETNRSHPQ
jgi:hypothetical protein